MLLITYLVNKESRTYREQVDPTMTTYAGDLEDFVLDWNREELHARNKYLSIPDQERYQMPIRYNLTMVVLFAHKVSAPCEFELLQGSMYNVNTHRSHSTAGEFDHLCKGDT